MRLIGGCRASDRGELVDPVSGHLRKIKFYPYRLSAAGHDHLTAKAFANDNL